MNESKQKKIVIPVEIKPRELLAKILLAVVLAERGYDIYIGNKIQHTALGRINPDVHFETAAKGKAQRLRRCKNNGVKTLILETEGAMWAGSMDDSAMVDAETLNHADCYCAWGEAAKQVIKAEAPSTRVEITGNPRFDLLQSQYRRVYDETASKLSEEYGNFILFNGNFGLVNGKTTIRERSYHFDDSDSDWKQIMNNLRTQSKIFPEFLKLIANTAERFHDKTIIVRPHPSGDESFYNNIFYSHDNIKIEKRLEVRPWIRAASVTIHNSCTTGVTSALLGTPVIAYIPDNIEVISTPNDVSKRCRTESEVFSYLEDCMSRNHETIPNESKEIIKKYIDNIEYLSSERIANVIDSLVKNKTTKPSLSESKELSIRQLSIRIFGSKRFEELWVKGIQDEKRHKFPYAPTDDVKSMFNTINRVSDGDISQKIDIDRINYMVNGFRIRRN